MRGTAAKTNPFSLGRVGGHVEVYTGYDYYDVGHTEIEGLIGGVRLWF